VAVCDEGAHVGRQASIEERRPVSWAHWRARLTGDLGDV
jgi:hypothetical protein